MDNFPKRLKDIRLINDYTVEYVANCLDISKQAISKYETGKTMPSSSSFPKIFELYSVDINYFSKKYVDDKRICFYRKIKQTTKKEIEKVDIYLDWCHDIVEETRKFVEIPMLDIPEFKHDLSISEKAQMLRQYWGLGQDPIESFDEILKQHGFHVFSIDFKDSKIDGFSCMFSEYPIIILNSSRGNADRQRFSLAHELGHMILHADNFLLKDSEDYLEQIEREADEFAGCFLMPIDTFSKKVIRKDVDNIILLSKEWGVSPEAVVMRCKMLGLLGENNYESEAFYKKLVQRVRQSKKYIPAQGRKTCTIKESVEQINQIKANMDIFINDLSLPIKYVEQICDVNNLSENVKGIDNEMLIEQVEGIQYSFAFE